MATFGKTDIGLSNKNAFWGNTKFGCKFEAPGSGEIIKISFYGKCFVGESGTAYAVVYSDNAGIPNAQLGLSDAITMDDTLKWWDFAFSTSVSIVNGTKYWLCINYVWSPYYYYDAGTINQTAFSGEITDPPPPSDPFGAVAAYYDYEVSIYATYTTGSARKICGKLVTGI